MSDIYADIRPFNDNEVKAVLERLAASEELVGALLKQRFPGWPAAVLLALRPLFHWRLRAQLQRLTSVEKFQMWLEPQIEQLLQRSTSVVEVSGLENLDPGKAHVWISNHRDIAMDPTMMNYSLHQAGWPTSRIAIGDNLLQNPDVADVMRLNKSFVVKRSIANKRQKLRELQRLSGYIRHSAEQGQSVWIAQREGRAKDNRDKTDTAVLKMLALHGRERNESFAETMQQLNPVPVSIQYEWDPCDQLKAAELVAVAQCGDYSKADDEDVRSILLGLTGQKGRVKVNFGQPLATAQLQDADMMAAAIDQQIAEMAEIWPVHQAALSLLRQQWPQHDWPELADNSDIAEKQQQLLQRLAGNDDVIRRQMLENYAAPVLPPVAL